jgi:ethanolamine utilization protein EutQ (cupin superfamily)
MWRNDMSVQHLTIDDTRAWFQAGEREVFIGDVLDVVTTPTTRIRFSRYGRGAMHEWMVTVDETLIVTKGALTVRSAAGAQTAKTGEVISLAKGTRVVFTGEEDDTEVVFVTHMHWADAQRQPARVDAGGESRAVHVPRLVPSLSVSSTPIRRGA